MNESDRKHSLKLGQKSVYNKFVVFWTLRPGEVYDIYGDVVEGMLMRSQPITGNSPASIFLLLLFIL